MSLINKLVCVAVLGFGAQVGQGMDYLPPADKELKGYVLHFNDIQEKGKKILSCFWPEIYEPDGYDRRNDLGLSYIYFAIGKSSLAECKKYKNSLLLDVGSPQASANYIYFPEDGHQPTTENAGKWSCANIESYNENSGVTEWYVKAFCGETHVKSSGRRLVNQKYLPKMGYDSNGTPKTIITFDDSIKDSSFKQKFYRTFRTIASDPIGRVLLYRILIEIHRHNNVSKETNIKDKEEGMDGFGSVNTERNKCRSIVIKEGEDEFDNKGIIQFAVQEISPTTLSIHYMGYINTARKEKTLRDIVLFHELLHWFHFLYTPKRYLEDHSNDLEKYSYLFRSLFGINDDESCAWGTVNLEEIRTILGTPNYDIPELLKFISPKAFIQNPIKPIEIDGKRYVPFEEHFMSSNNYIEIDDKRYVPFEECYMNPDMDIKIDDKGYVPFKECYMEGDDLSENAYIMSRYIYGIKYNKDIKDSINKFEKKEPVRMEYGHSYEIECVKIIDGDVDNFKVASKEKQTPNDIGFRLAEKVAEDCYNTIISRRQDYNEHNFDKSENIESIVTFQEDGSSKYDIVPTKDFSQPMTKAAAEYSCANIGAYEEEHIVTDWYVVAFGGYAGFAIANDLDVSQLDVKEVMGGYDSNGTPKIIITFDDSVNDISFKRKFWKTFHIIAADPVGRVLLYRILLEIQRFNGDNPKNGKDCFGNIYAERNKCRSIVIKQDDEIKFHSDGYITISSNDNFQEAVLNKNSDSYNTTWEKSNLENEIFCQLLSWLHFLQTPNNFNIEIVSPCWYNYFLKSYDIVNESELLTWGEIWPELIATTLGKPDYRDSEQLKLMPSEVFLKKPIDSDRDVHIEKKGYIPYEDRYIEGQDLSLNAFRLSQCKHKGIEFKLRWGGIGYLIK